MSQVDVQSILNQVEQLLAIAGALPEQSEQAVEKLLNVVEELCADRQTLAKEVERLRQQLDNLPALILSLKYCDILFRQDFLRPLISRPMIRRRELQASSSIHTFFAIRSTRRTTRGNEKIV